MWEVLQKFNTKDTSFKQYEKPITEFPTITLCTPKERFVKSVFGRITHRMENGDPAK